MNWTRVWHKEKVIAQGALVNFEPKGVAMIALGAWGNKSHPDVVSDSESWRRVYYLGCCFVGKRSGKVCKK